LKNRFFSGYHIITFHPYPQGYHLFMLINITRKQLLICIRVAITLIVAAFVLSGNSVYPWAYTLGLFWILLLLVTDFIILFLPGSFFEPGKFLQALVFFDTVLLAAGLGLTDSLYSDLYLVFFLIMCMAGMSNRLFIILLCSFVFAAIYGGFLFYHGCGIVSGWPDCIMRPVFIIVVATAYTLVRVLVIREEKQHRFHTQERHRMLFAASDVMVYTVGLSGEYLSANPKLYEALGFDSEVAMLGLFYSDFHSPEETAVFQKHIDMIFAQGKPVMYESFDSNLKQWLSHTLSPIYDESQNAVFAVAGVSKDITERVKKEEELKKAYLKLRETRDQLIQKDKMAALGRLASGVAHEIRNPLEIISMGVDYLENIIPADHPKAGQSVEKINQAIDRANFIINDVLKFSRKTQITVEPVDICQVVKESLALSRHYLEKSGVKVVSGLPSAQLSVAGNRNMLIQVMLNIINNAVDAMDGSEVKELGVRVYTAKVNDVGYKTGYRRADYFKIGEQMVVVEISDTGRGMDEDVLSKIFEPFFTTKTTGEGTGLGLGLAHMILDRMNGTIDVSSSPGKGSVFYVKVQPVGKIQMIKGKEDGQ
jgi:PAS domain S-box-containing protein